ncbi:bifunctional hydroxymethylpyrimidine kinase/phosphomethylpyrimidine kinase [Promicromonospora thailandica]|uniref:Hydroxymethylpyrimidine/phosphomethylpyrimidine kinase n=1 Tax=Promicromonospora thailandica TaxID=765201 RepID=A0A9X2FYS1_9MICO|nr:bifunctional hydroxymethylpyrimidine kinase/phosphomethylpyrimidine kinase [Promicromonospora thailandica]MCP2263845.1 hydroxymethylpyrimidine/phosphomethylpyrimidine kinase [Promicromonospora thailandica]BFF17858.1 bifunctional hydroxymethylpyrimidine kinase/phosphomethylpyrimidine kinase [Promicromonospora thailandica]
MGSVLPDLSRTRAHDHPVVALTVAGSDPSGGAGIQADLKTFAALGGYGCAVLTGLTAQSTTGVTRVHPVPADMVTAQLETLFADVAVDAVKIGMTTDAAVARAVAAVLRDLRAGADRPVVVLDPVMVATSGDRLLAADAEAVLRDELLPLADLVTPNLPEAAVLLGISPARDAAEAAAQATALLRLGPGHALVKGGHLDGPQAVDQLAGPDGVVALRAPRVATRNTHGTGCTLSSACAVLRPAHDGWAPAVRAAKEYLTGALRAADDLVVGGTGTASGPWTGHGPVDHGWAGRDRRRAARPDSAVLPFETEVASL